MEEHLKKLIKGIELFDRNAEDSMYKLCSGKWKYFLRRWRAPRDTTDDIIQDTFWDLIKAIRKRVEITYFWGFTRNILYKKYVNHLKKDFHNPDLNKMYLEKSKVHRHIENTKDKIKKLHSNSPNSEELTRLHSNIDSLIREGDHISEEISALIKRIADASHNEDPLILQRQKKLDN